MNLKKLFTEIGLFSFVIDEQLMIHGVSNNLFERSGINFIDKNVIDILALCFDNEELSNRKFLDEIRYKCENSFQSGTSIMDHIVLTDENNNCEYFYRFSMGIDVIQESERKIILKFANFEVKNVNDSFYQALFDDFSDYFNSLNMNDNIGSFVIDYSGSKTVLIGDKNFPKVLGIPSMANYYDEFSLENPLFAESKPFVFKYNLLKTGKVEHIFDEIPVGDKNIQTELRVVKKDSNNKALYICGIVRDITMQNDFQSLMKSNTIYDLAIRSGRIGIFYYDVDQYGTDYFEANDIYAELIGLDKCSNGLYRMDDFTDALLDIENEILGNKMDISESLESLLTGQVDGTVDDVLKVYNRKKDTILYLLSSSKIVERYEDGNPKKFGGIILDVTDRIQSEKDKIKFAETDELTMLPNKRKFDKDILEKRPGFGLFFDLDNFKKINDKYGHSVGDEALKVFAKSLLKLQEKHSDTSVYRLYGDEFFVFYEGATEEDVIDYNNELSLEVEKQVKVLNIDIPLKASMGYSKFEIDRDIDEFIKEADYAMYEEKIGRKKQMKS